MNQYFKLVCLILLNTSNYTYNMGLPGSVLTKQVCQKVIPAGLALLTSYLAKFKIQDEQLFTPAELQQVKACVNKPQASVLSAHIKQVTFLSPAYLEAMRIKGLNYFETNQHLSQAQIIGFRCAEFGNPTIAAGLSTIYLNLNKGDFVLARSAASLVKQFSPNLNLAVTRLLAAFNNDDFNNYNICIKYELDPLWHELKLEQKFLIANNQELRRAMNLELALRHELLLKLQVELGLDHLNHAGLQAFLVGLMQFSPEQKFSVLLSLTPTYNLHVAFYKHNSLLKAFNKNPYVHNFHVPVGLNPNQIRALNLYHTLHGDMNPGRKPTGCHSIWGRCCFVLKKVKFWGDNNASICDIIRNGVSKPSSSIFPRWHPGKIMDKLINWAQSSHLEISEKRVASPIRIFRLIKTCCKNNVEFRVNVVRGIGNAESFYPFTQDIINNSDKLICKCME